MIEVSIKSDIPEKIKAFQGIPEILLTSRRSALSSVGFLIMEEIREHIESEGNGRWPEVHPLTRDYKKKYGIGGSWKERKLRFPGAFHFLGKFARYKVNRRATYVVMGFGTFRARDVRRGKPVRFSRNIERIARGAQRKRTLPVDQDRRRLFGATRIGRDRDPGEDYFPVSKNFRKIEIPARPILVPVFRKVSNRVFPVFQAKFLKSFTGKFKRL